MVIVLYWVSTWFCTTIWSVYTWNYTTIWSVSTWLYTTIWSVSTWPYTTMLYVSMWLYTIILSVSTWPYTTILYVSMWLYTTILSVSTLLAQWSCLSPRGSTQLSCPVSTWLYNQLPSAPVPTHKEEPTSFGYSRGNNQCCCPLSLSGMVYI